METAQACGTVVTPSATPSVGYTQTTSPTPTLTSVNTDSSPATESKGFWLWFIIALAIIVPSVLVVLGGVIWFIVWKRKKSGHYDTVA